MPHPVSSEHLSSVLVLDLDDSRRLDPGLTIYLNGNPLITQDGDLYRSTLIQTHTYKLHIVHLSACVFFPLHFGMCSHLCYAVVLQLNDSGHSHLHTPKHSYNFQDLIIKRRGTEDLHNTHNKRRPAMIHKSGKPTFYSQKKKNK